MQPASRSRSNGPKQQQQQQQQQQPGSTKGRMMGHIPDLEAHLSAVGVAEGVAAGGQRVALSLLAMGSQPMMD